jgi:hypothetical protein
LTTCFSRCIVEVWIQNIILPHTRKMSLLLSKLDQFKHRLLAVFSNLLAVEATENSTTASVDHLIEPSSECLTELYWLQMAERELQEAERLLYVSWDPLRFFLEFVIIDKNHHDKAREHLSNVEMYIGYVIGRDDIGYVFGRTKSLRPDQVAKFQDQATKYRARHAFCRALVYKCDALKAQCKARNRRSLFEAMHFADKNVHFLLEAVHFTDKAVNFLHRAVKVAKKAAKIAREAGDRVGVATGTVGDWSKSYCQDIATKYLTYAAKYKKQAAEYEKESIKPLAEAYQRLSEKTEDPILAAACRVEEARYRMQGADEYGMGIVQKQAVAEKDLLYVVKQQFLITHYRLKVLQGRIWLAEKGSAITDNVSMTWKTWVDNWVASLQPEDLSRWKARADKSSALKEDLRLFIILQKICDCLQRKEIVLLWNEVQVMKLVLNYLVEFSLCSAKAM